MAEEGQNRVLIGLPDRLQKAKVAISELERKLRDAEELKMVTLLLLAARPLIGDEATLDRLEGLYDAPN